MPASPPEIPPARIPTPPNSSQETSRLARLTYALAWCGEHGVEPRSVTVPYVGQADVSVDLDDLLRVRGLHPVEVQPQPASDDGLYPAGARVLLYIDGLLLRAYTHEQPWVGGDVRMVRGPVTSWPTIGKAAAPVELLARAVKHQADLLADVAAWCRTHPDLETRRRSAIALAEGTELTSLSRLMDRLTDACAHAGTVAADELGLWLDRQPLDVSVDTVRTSDDVQTPTDVIVDEYNAAVMADLHRVG